MPMAIPPSLDNIRILRAPYCARPEVLGINKGLMAALTLSSVNSSQGLVELKCFWHSVTQKKQVFLVLDNLIAPDI